MTYHALPKCTARPSCSPRSLFNLVFMLFALLQAALADPLFVPENAKDLKAPLSFANVQQILQEAAKSPHVKVSEEGKSVQGRPLYLVNIRRSEDIKWTVFFYGAQHGDEPAGANALALMIRDLARDPRQLPKGVDLWIMPQINPDGYEAGKRRNANDADLNRDHFTLEQPETQTLHRVAQRIMPDISVDCHEFARDTADYVAKGWMEWPLIMIDTANHPVYPTDSYLQGLEWVRAVEHRLNRKGMNAVRYYVGDAPPDGENRYSSLEADDARNGLGALGGLSFIIESGVYRKATDPNSDLSQRVLAYREIFDEFLMNKSLRAASRKAIAEARNPGTELPAFLPINTFWGSNGLKPTSVKVVDAASHEVLQVEMGNFMRDRIVKKTVPRPLGYAIGPQAAPTLKGVLDLRGIDYETLSAPRRVNVERCRLLRVEEDSDPVYERYGGRQIVEREPPISVELPAGSLVVSLDTASKWRAVVVLEPCALYGIYQFGKYRDLVGQDQIVPVMRIVGGAQ